MAGTPIEYKDSDIDELLLQLEKGIPLRTICSNKGMPSKSSVYDWIEGDEDFAGRFRAARARGVHALAEECLVIADEHAIDAVDVSHKRLRIDTRLRLAGKWLPKAYGDKVDHTSSDGSMTPKEIIIKAG